MKWLFDQMSIRVSQLTTKTYSTSFSLAIYFIDARLRNDIYCIYGFVRLADEIVDSFEGYNKRLLLEKLREETYEAIRMGISVNPILNSFQRTVHSYKIDNDLVNLFFKSMEMDLEDVSYDRQRYSTYILGSAEVVGLMCLQVFTEGRREKYEELRNYAMKLGAAFQKINFLRDLKHDYNVLGRTYFPEVDIRRFSVLDKSNIENEIEEDLKIALKGIRMLPLSSRAGVYLAYMYYKSLFRKIKDMPPQKVLTERIRINNGHKFRLMLNCLIKFKMNKLGWVSL